MPEDLTPADLPTSDILTEFFYALTRNGLRLGDLEAAIMDMEATGTDPVTQYTNGELALRVRELAERFRVVMARQTPASLGGVGYIPVCSMIELHESEPSAGLRCS